MQKPHNFNDRQIERAANSCAWHLAGILDEPSELKKMIGGSLSKDQIAIFVSRLRLLVEEMVANECFEVSAGSGFRYIKITSDHEVVKNAAQAASIRDSQIHYFKTVYLQEDGQVITIDNLSDNVTALRYTEQPDPFYEPTKFSLDDVKSWKKGGTEYRFRVVEVQPGQVVKTVSRDQRIEQQIDKLQVLVVGEDATADFESLTDQEICDGSDKIRRSSLRPYKDFTGGKYMGQTVKMTQKGHYSIFSDPVPFLIVKKPIQFGCGSNHQTADSGDIIYLDHTFLKIIKAAHLDQGSMRFYSHEGNLLNSSKLRQAFIVGALAFSLFTGGQDDEPDHAQFNDEPQWVLNSHLDRQFV